MSTFDIKEITALAFNYVGATFPTFAGDVGDLAVFPSLKDITFELLRGRQYFTTLEFSHNGQTYKLPNEPLISLSSKKRIVETPTVGSKRKGTVNEYITTEDYNLTFRGLCVIPDAPDQYPSDQIAEVIRLFEINEAVEIVDNRFLELFGIRNVILKELSWDEMEGQQGVQKYTIRAKSEQDFFADLVEDEELNNLLN
jgi:hypothetical protein